MKSTAKSSIKTKNPSFFKVLVMDDFKTRLRIPPAYARKYGECVKKRNVTLVSKYGCGRVQLNKLDGHFYFLKGWEKFAKHHVLKFGDFLVFKYVGTSTFKVKVFDPSCCEREVLEVESGKSIVKVKTENEEVIHIDCENGKKSRESSLKAVKREAENFSSKHPFFISVMTPSKVGNYAIMDIPSAFFKKHMKKVKQVVKLEASGNVWTAILSLSTGGNYTYGRIQGGWRKLVKANHLKAKDVCVFEMVRSQDAVFKVHIFRA